MSTEPRTTAGTPLARPCSGAHHGDPVWYPRNQYDPGCMNCFARVEILAQHDHLHLDAWGADSVPCTTPGIGGVPGRTVKCKCGAYHH